MKRGRLIWLAIVGALTPVLASADTVATFELPSGVRIRIVEAPFDASRFRVQGCGDQEPACLINGRIPFGAALGLPQTFVKSITATCGGRSYSLEASGMYNAWGSRPLEVKGVIRYFGGRCTDARTCVLRGLFSDAAGSFVAEWCIVDGVPFRTILTDSNDVIDAFTRQIDPPVLE